MPLYVFECFLMYLSGPCTVGVSCLLIETDNFLLTLPISFTQDRG